MRWRFAILAMLTTIATAHAATFESGARRVALLELYTSEGCSSCPPAEARLAKLQNDDGLWKEVVPVAFHVNYWDDLGWPDRFASPAFTQRQRDYAARWRAQSVYTPQFVLNGRDGTHSEGPTNPGTLRASTQPDGSVDITFHPENPIVGEWIAEIAPLASGVVSDVRRGENAGRKLAHEFVALGLISVPMNLRGDTWSARAELPKQTEAPISALAVWVHPKGDPTPLQAAGGWLKNSASGL